MKHLAQLKTSAWNDSPCLALTLWMLWSRFAASLARKGMRGRTHFEADAHFKRRTKGTFGGRFLKETKGWASKTSAALPNRQE